MRVSPRYRDEPDGHADVSLRRGGRLEYYQRCADEQARGSARRHRRVRPRLRRSPGAARGTGRVWIAVTTFASVLAMGTGPYVDVDASGVHIDFGRVGQVGGVSSAEAPETSAPRSYPVTRRSTGCSPVGRTGTPTALPLARLRSSGSWWRRRRGPGIRSSAPTRRFSPGWRWSCLGGNSCWWRCFTRSCGTPMAAARCSPGWPRPATAASSCCHLKAAGERPSSRPISPWETWVLCSSTPGGSACRR